MENVDHGEGIGFILGPGAVKDISPVAPIFHKSYLVDRTYFGPAVSGRLPKKEADIITLCNTVSPGDIVVANENIVIDDKKITEKLNY